MSSFGDIRHYSRGDAYAQRVTGQTLLVLDKQRLPGMTRTN